MKHVRCIKTALLFVAAIMVIGCKSKQETPQENTPAPPQTSGDTKSLSGQNVSGEVATSPQDKTDAQAAAARVLAQMEAGEFAKIYNDAEAGFKKIGSEAQFVAKFQQVRQKTGPFKNPKVMSLVTRPNKTHVLIYRLENERFVTERRLTFSRSKSGQMELFGLNQHDEPKK